MKECPKCGTVYTDVTLSFCLSDGSALILQIDEEKTAEFTKHDIDVETPDRLPQETQQATFPTDETVVRTTPIVAKTGVSPFWIFSTFGLLAIFLVSGFAFWYFLDGILGDRSRQTADKPNTNVENTEKPSNTIKEQSAGKTTQTNTNNNEAETIKTATPKRKLYRVVGVKGGDVLYIRPKAGNLKVSVGKIPPGATGIKITGGGKTVGKSRWVPIVYRGKRGWVNSRFIAREK